MKTRGSVVGEIGGRPDVRGSRGVEDVLIAVCDGLTGLPAA